MMRGPYMITDRKEGIAIYVDVEKVGDLITALRFLSEHPKARAPKAVFDAVYRLLLDYKDMKEEGR